jgi:hypothetical protein
VTREAAAVRLHVAGANDRGQFVNIEMILLPLSQDGRSVDRVLGLLTPPRRPSWLDLHPIRRLDLLEARRLHAGEPMATPARAVDRPRLVVLEGGRR